MFSIIYCSVTLRHLHVIIPINSQFLLNRSVCRCTLNVAWFENASYYLFGASRRRRFYKRIISKMTSSLRFSESIHIFTFFLSFLRQRNVYLLYLIYRRMSSVYISNLGDSRDCPEFVNRGSSRWEKDKISSNWLLYDSITTIPAVLLPKCCVRLVVLIDSILYSILSSFLYSPLSFLYSFLSSILYSSLSSFLY